MASLQHIGDAFYCQFLFDGKRHSIAFGKVRKAEADRRKANVENLLSLLKQGRISIPPGVSPSDFMLHDGRPPVEQEFQSHKSTTFAELRDQYIETFSNGAIEANTLYTSKIHLRHIEDSLGKRFVMSGLTLKKLQEHVSRRLPKVTATTIQKELATFRAVFNWGVRSKIVHGAFPTGIVYPKTDEKPPFQTFDQIKRAIKNGSPETLWETLYLNAAEIAELLAVAKASKATPWAYTAIFLAAHTGMRRSEIVRSQVEDIDLIGNVITIREKKKSRTQRTSRRCPISRPLAIELKKWLKTRKGKAMLFGTGDGPLCVQSAQDAFNRALKNSKFAVVRGWHTLRHSWVSNMANNGVDQRIIDDAIGHSTEQQRRRYRHLLPATSQAALDRVFGN